MSPSSSIPEPPFLTARPEIDRRVREIGDQLFDRMESQAQASVFSRKGAYGRLMEWSLRDPAFKAQLFRFVDVLPVLSKPEDVVQHLQDYLGDHAVELHPALRAGLAAVNWAPGLVARAVRAQVTDMATQFVAGETPSELLQRFHTNASAGIATTIDLLGETVVNEREAEQFLRRNLEVLDTVGAALANSRAPLAFSDVGPAGPLPRINLSVKISALTPDVHPADPDTSIQALATRLRPILRRAAQFGALVNFDMESYKLKDLTFALFRQVLSEPEFATTPAVGIALQAYLRDSRTDSEQLIAWARSHSRRVTVRLVKGAYWDYETILAQQKNWPVPVWAHKAETDANYESLTRLLLEHADVVSAAFATHNVRSCAHAIAQAEQLGRDPREYEFQALYGMADDLKHALVAAGHRVREYCPIGELLPGMAYLVRRLLENTSNEGFLRARATGRSTRDELLQNPVDQIDAPSSRWHHRAPTLPATPARSPADDPDNLGFRNAPATDFSRPEARESMRNALRQIERKLGAHYPPVVGGKTVRATEFVPSINPARPNQVIGFWGRSRIDDANAAIAAARAAQPGWAATAVPARVALVERLADHLQTHRFELAALEVLEAGKPWIEADADVAEAIDFCRYYAREMLRLGLPRSTQAVPGESNREIWQARGIGVVIAPWNFPLAILCGMTVAPLVGGNAVIIKPAEQTSVVAGWFMNAIQDVGFPPGVVQFLPGHGEDVGAHLVAHPQIDFVAFTGSRAVGLAIWESAARPQPGQRNLKKVVCEMGGKNALIMDSDADLDEAIPAALYSAFGFSGQKCSALSRLILLDPIYDTFLERFLPACASVPVGDPIAPGTVVGPVIDAEAQARIRQRISDAARDCTLAFQGSAPAAGFFVAPTVFTNVPPEHFLAREELFGPVLAVFRARNLDHAFELFNATEYALTGGIFSRNPTALARAERELQVGNLYLNRGITGALVERQPFGGYRMSGAGTKAGGPGYLENFLFSRVVTENVLRRGFTPPESGE